MLSSDVGGGKSEPRSRKLPQSDAGGIRDETTAKTPVVRGSIDETTAKESVVEHGHDDREKSIPNSRGKSKEPKEHSQQQAKRASKIWRKMEKTQSLTPRRNLSPKARERRRQKANQRPRQSRWQNPIAETKAKANVGSKAKSSPKPFRGGRTGGDWEVSNAESEVGNKRGEKDDGGVSQASTVAVALQNTMAVGSTPASVCGGGAAET